VTDIDFEVQEHSDRLLELQFTGERRTVPQALKERLLEDDQVETSTVLQDHPVLDEPQLVIRTAEGRRPETALKQAAKSLGEDYDELEDAFLDQL